MRTNYLALAFANPFAKLLDDLDSKMDLSALEKLPWNIIIFVFAAITIIGIVLIWARIILSSRKPKKTSKQDTVEPNIVSSEIFEEKGAVPVPVAEPVQRVKGKAKRQPKSTPAQEASTATPTKPAKAAKAKPVKKSRPSKPVKTKQSNEIPWGKPTSVDGAMTILSQGQIPDSLGWVKITNTSSGSIKLYRAQNLFTFTLRLINQMKVKVPSRTREVLAVQLLAANNKYLTDAHRAELDTMKCITK